MNLLGEKSKEELRELLCTEIGEENVKLLNNDDIQHVGMFLLVLRLEAIKRIKSKSKPVLTPDGSTYSS